METFQFWNEFKINKMYTYKCMIIEKYYLIQISYLKIYVFQLVSIHVNSIFFIQGKLKSSNKYMSRSMTNTLLQNKDHETLVKSTNSMQFTKY